MNNQQNNFFNAGGNGDPFQAAPAHVVHVVSGCPLGEELVQQVEAIQNTIGAGSQKLDRHEQVLRVAENYLTDWTPFVNRRLEEDRGIQTAQDQKIALLEAKLDAVVEELAAEKKRGMEREQIQKNFLYWFWVQHKAEQERVKVGSAAEPPQEPPKAFPSSSSTCTITAPMEPVGQVTNIYDVGRNIMQYCISKRGQQPGTVAVAEKEVPTSVRGQKRGYNDDSGPTSSKRVKSVMGDMKESGESPTMEAGKEETGTEQCKTSKKMP